VGQGTAPEGRARGGGAADRAADRAGDGRAKRA